MRKLIDKYGVRIIATLVSLGLIAWQDIHNWIDAALIGSIAGILAFAIDYYRKKR